MAGILGLVGCFLAGTAIWIVVLFAILSAIEQYIASGIRYNKSVALRTCLLLNHCARIGPFLVLASATLAVPGCSTSGIPRLQPAGPAWHIQQGQAVWRPNRSRPELSGELVLARQSDGSSVFNFSKTPLPVTTGQTTLTNWLIEFPAKHFAFSGKGAPPARFTWLYLSQALAGEPIPHNLRFVAGADGGWRLENLKSGEFIEGFLTE